MFSKGFQKLLLTRIKTIVLLTTDFQNPKLQVFQPKLGCLKASFNLQETFCYNIEGLIDPFMCFPRYTESI